MAASGGSGNDGNIQQTQPPFSMKTAMNSDSEDLSSLFHQLLSPPPPGMEPNHCFSDPYSHANYIPHPSSHLLHPSAHHHHANNTISTNTCDDFTSPPVENGESSELPSPKPVPPPRTSSKRSRAAEFHNLSEKTDKASMLDEAIEYLKQLQLQVQTLMMRNGLSLHPMSLPGGVRPMIFPQTGLNFDEANQFQNFNSGIASFSNDESMLRPSYNFSKHGSISNQSVVPASMTNITTSDTSTSFQPYIKDALCGSMPQQLPNTTRMGKTPSPDVS
ncbi:hypothetical protein RIF29_06003 [Crotalaria pallida]|uniref:BHLH domain-containing protein n=1 Tax=Crotalaria pallida TaxID=3830 RepID=A0AAN9PA33_CROPI